MTRRRPESGQTLVVFALVLALFLVGMVALVADLGAVFVTYNQVDDAALLAIQSGASAIDEGSFYTGRLQLDAGTAVVRPGFTPPTSGCCAVSPGVVAPAML